MSKSIKQILLVEDELETRLIIHLMLHLRQFEVDFAEDGQAAVKMANNKKYDYILMDIGLPKLSGIDACIAIRNNEAQKMQLKVTPIIAISERVQLPEIEQCLEVGMNAILLKPIQPQCFERLITSLEKESSY